MPWPPSIPSEKDDELLTLRKRVADLESILAASKPTEYEVTDPAAMLFSLFGASIGILLFIVAIVYLNRLWDSKAVDNNAGPIAAIIGPLLHAVARPFEGLAVWLNNVLP